VLPVLVGITRACMLRLIRRIMIVFDLTDAKTTAAHLRDDSSHSVGGSSLTRDR